MKMNERLSTRSLADILAIQTGLDKERAEKFIDVLSSCITQGIENNKSMKVMGLGTFKIILVRERESVHIQTGERFIISAHHKLSFIPDKDLKEQINRPFAFFEPIEATEDILSLKKQPFEDETEKYADPESGYAKIDPEVPIVTLDDDLTDDLSKELKNIHPGAKPEDDKLIPDMTEIYSFPEDEDESIASVPEVSFEEPGPIRHISRKMADDADAIYYEYEKVGIPWKEDEGDTDFIHDENENTELEKDNQLQNRKITKKAVPFWLWFLLLPFLFVVGVSIGTYAFLHYNTEKSYEKTSFPSDNNQAGTERHDEADPPLPIGESRVSDTDESSAGDEGDETEHDVRLIWASIGNTDSIFTGNTPNGEAVANTRETKDAKKEGKPVIDWLAPSSGSSKPEPKRADKPNAAIEEKNKSLPATSRSRFDAKTRNNRTASAAGKSGNTSSEKVIPARVRMSAGSSLTQIAMEHYGDKVFWVYIYDYNKSRIKDFNNIPVGTEIRLPQPKTYGINAKNKTSVQKARQKQSELLKWDRWDDYQ
jgi:nucleoid DNA-binding protein